MKFLKNSWSSLKQIQQEESKEMPDHAASSLSCYTPRPLT